MGNRLIYTPAFKTGFRPPDRTGPSLGLALVLALLLVAGFTPLPADPWWQESRMVSRLMPRCVSRMSSLLPL